MLFLCLPSYVTSSCIKILAYILVNSNGNNKINIKKKGLLKMARYPFVESVKKSHLTYAEKNIIALTDVGSIMNKEITQKKNQSK